jgi:hypothetical protein
MNQPISRRFPILVILTSLAVAGPLFAAGGMYDKLEASFELPQVKGNPFDFMQNNVKVTFTAPDGNTVRIPAFFDGGQTWRARYTPAATGKYTISAITLNGEDAKPRNLTPSEFDVAGTPKPGFMRIDPKNKKRFIFDDGSPYYPVGYNLAWRGTNMPPLPESIARMGKASVNWSRIWMNHWDSKNLDWMTDASQQPKLGELNLTVAKTWDDIVSAADANGVHFHLVLQHHGQYSTTVNPNWQENPWNKALGGWLDNPVEFFTDAKAKALTKAKYRYIIARWGYSPSIMAWEIFNEVQFTDAFKKDPGLVGSWHAEMAKFIREQDPYHHLITTSSELSEPKLWTAMDYYDAHTYPPDIVASIGALDDEHLDRPYFYGEIGSDGGGAANGDQGEPIHQAIWASMMSRSSGAAEFWNWDIVEPNNLLFHYAAAQKFIHDSGLLAQEGLKPIEIVADTPGRATLRFGPGSGWAKAKTTHFTVKPSGIVDGLGGMPAYLQGSGGNHALFPFAEFGVNYAVPGKFTVRFSEMTPEGINVTISLDGKPSGNITMAASPPAPPAAPGAPAPQRQNPKLDASLEIAVPTGQHTIRLVNTGGDWVHIRDFTLSDYSPELAILAKGNESFAVAWVRAREPGHGKTASGKLSIPGLAAGAYRVVWMDTASGNTIHDEVANSDGSGPTTIQSPAITTDAALFVTRQ